MFSAIKIINSKFKKNIRFVAAGSYQIEFFENEGQEYFTIYQFNYGGEGGASYHLINLSESSVAKESDNHFQVIYGSSTYKIYVNGSHKVFSTRRLWGWLPLSRFGGKVSSAGISTLSTYLSQHTGDSSASNT